MGPDGHWLRQHADPSVPPSPGSTVTVAETRRQPPSEPAPCPERAAVRAVAAAAAVASAGEVVALGQHYRTTTGTEGTTAVVAAAAEASLSTVSGSSWKLPNCHSHPTVAGTENDPEAPSNCLLAGAAVGRVVAAVGAWGTTVVVTVAAAADHLHLRTLGVVLLLHPGVPAAPKWHSN